MTVGKTRTKDFFCLKDEETSVHHHWPLPYNWQLTVTQRLCYACCSFYSTASSHPADVSARPTPDCAQTVARQANSAQLFKHTMDGTTTLGQWKNLLGRAQKWKFSLKKKGRRKKGKCDDATLRHAYRCLLHVLNLIKFYCCYSPRYFKMSQQDTDVSDNWSPVEVRQFYSLVKYINKSLLVYFNSIYLEFEKKEGGAC